MKKWKKFLAVYCFLLLVNFCFRWCSGSKAYQDGNLLVNLSFPLLAVFILAGLVYLVRKIRTIKRK